MHVKSGLRKIYVLVIVRKSVSRVISLLSRDRGTSCEGSKYVEKDEKTIVTLSFFFNLEMTEWSGDCSKIFNKVPGL